jgi:hypothetical protein
LISSSGGLQNTKTIRNGLKGDYIISIGLLLLLDIMLKEKIFQKSAPQTIGMEKRERHDRPRVRIVEGFTPQPPTPTPPKFSRFFKVLRGF